MASTARQQRFSAIEYRIECRLFVNGSHFGEKWHFAFTCALFLYWPLHAVVLIAGTFILMFSSLCVAVRRIYRRSFVACTECTHIEHIHTHRRRIYF